MSTTKYENIIKTLDEIAVKTRDAKTDNIAAWVRMSLEDDHKPTIALVSFNLNHSDRLNMIKQFFGVEIPEEIVRMIEGKSACLILDYHETPAFLNDQSIAGSRIIYGVPCESLRDYRIVICDEVQSKEEWMELSNEIDVACLIVNATMPMKQMERNWLKECAKPLFAENELALLITRMDQLNEDEDIQAVCKVIADSLKLLSISPKVFENMKDSLEWMSHFVRDDSVPENHDRRVVKNGLTAMNNQMKSLIEDTVIDTTTIQYAIDQLNRQQKTFELAGQLASESILSNKLNRLKVQLCDGIRDYGRQMERNVRKRIEDSPLDQLKSMDDKINGYISGSWDYYLSSMSSRADEELEVIAQKLTEQMEADAGLLVSELDELARRTVYNALGLTLAPMGAGRDGLTDLRSIRHSRNALKELNVGDVSDQLRKETRNMMLLSIPLFFVNPLASLGNIFAAKAYGKIRTNSVLKNIRSEMAEQMGKACCDSAESLVHQVELCFDDEIRTGALHIRSAYNGLIRQVESSLVELRNLQEEKMAVKDYLDNQVNAVFPNLMASL